MVRPPAHPRAATPRGRKPRLPRRGRVPRPRRGLPGTPAVEPPRPQVSSRSLGQPLPGRPHAAGVAEAQPPR
eukprot:1158856-Lingulodinium_polyedra.AAC.1